MSEDGGQADGKQAIVACLEMVKELVPAML